MTEQELISRVSDGFEEAKAGNALKVYNEVAPYHDAGTLPLKSHYPFAWIIYYTLHQMPDGAIAERKRLLARYLKLSVVRPHKLHSMILTEANRLYKNARDAAFNKDDKDVVRFSIVKFSTLWDLSNLRPGDWRRKEYEGKQLSSTVEKFITLYVDELEQTREAPSQAFSDVMEKAMTEYADSFNLMSQRASLHILAGENDEARRLLCKALLGAPGKFFLWSKLASLVAGRDEVRLRIALLYKALVAPGQEQFKGKVRMRLAEAWLSLDAFARAHWELQKVKALYEANGWHLSSAFKAAWNRIPEGTAVSDPTEAYRRVEHLADDMIYASLPQVRVRKTYHKTPTAEDNARQRYGRPAPVAWRVTDESGQNYWLQPHRFKLQADLPMGTQLMIRLHEGKPVAAELDAAAE